MSVAYTSKAALAQLGQKFGQQAAAVYLCIAEWPGDVGPSIADIGDKLKLQYSTVSARVNKLRAIGAISEGPFKLNGSGVQAKSYRAQVYHDEPIPVRTPTPQQELFAGATPRAFSN